MVTPSIGVDLPTFYTAGMIPRAAGGAALLLAGIDGKVQVVENGAMRPVAGTRDWGSDFAVMRSGCGAGTQIIASSSGEAMNDSLRAFEIPALDAVPDERTAGDGWNSDSAVDGAGWKSVSCGGAQCGR